MNATFALPKRTVVIGAGGFVGGAVVARLKAKRANVLPVTRREVDLLSRDAAGTLMALLQPGDAIVAAAARAPCKDMAMLIDNMIMTKAMLDALAKSEISHVINISSDAVYPDEPLPLCEKTLPAPTTLHGAMHLAREIGFATAITAPLAILRPSLLYGPDDPHNGYGPNRFLRHANAGKDIVLFGEGEERRDHVLVEDVAELVVLALAYRSRGILNIATGTVHSFRSIAERAIDLAANKVSLICQPRQGPMPHKGYRPFDVAAVRAAFPDFNFTPLFEGMAEAMHDMTNV
jgi:UDP-glucose 4-epimerase